MFYLSLFGRRLRTCTEGLGAASCSEPLGAPETMTEQKPVHATNLIAGNLPAIKQVAAQSLSFWHKDGAIPPAPVPSTKGLN